MVEVPLHKLGCMLWWGDICETECCGGESDAKQSDVVWKQMRNRVLWWGDRCETVCFDGETDAKQYVSRHLVGNHERRRCWRQFSTLTVSYQRGTPVQVHSYCFS